MNFFYVNLLNIFMNISDSLRNEYFNLTNVVQRERNFKCLNKYEFPFSFVSTLFFTLAKNLRNE